MRGLDIDQDAATFAGYRCRLGFFAGNNEITNIDFFVFVAFKAAVTFSKGAFAAVVAAF